MTEAGTARLSAALDGRYRIVRRLGEGGMATVYLAEDLKHERNVALKILKPELAAVIGGERFIAEIKTTANLQHPHILPLFDSGATDGFLYYVMPYIEGETLRERIAREKQLAVDESLAIARDVASALDYAHRHNVIHRDIKPENILLHDGQPVVADFGIALAISAAGGGRMTETGLSLGTPHYMSPEQATADRDLSARSDVYSLACVLYEMLAGDPPHAGPTAQAILMKILTEDARPVAELRRAVPGHVSAALLKALEKLPADRFESAEAFRAALDDEGFVYTPAGSGAARASARSAPTVDAPAPGPAWLRALPWGLTAVFAAAAATAWLAPEEPSSVQRFEVVLEDPLLNSHGPSLALSPDGSTLAYMGSQNRVYVRSLSELSARLIPNTQGSRDPFFSPDGRSIGFTQGPPQDDAIKTISLDGTPAVTLTGDHFPGASWGDDGYVYLTDLAGTLYKVSDQGGPREILGDPSKGTGFRWPQALPGGRALLVTTFDIQGSDLTSGDSSAGTVLGTSVSTFDLATGEIKHQRASQYARVAGDYIFWLNSEATLMVTRFDLDALEVEGESLPLAAGFLDAGFGAGDFAVSPSGTLVYSAVAGAESGETIGWVTRDGVFTPLADQIIPGVANFSTLALSPNERFVALEAVSGDPGQIERDIWIYDLDQGLPTRLTFQGGNSDPDWLSDGRTVAYLSAEGGEPRAILGQPYDRSGTEQRLFGAGWSIVSFDAPPQEGPFALYGNPSQTRPFGGLYVGQPGEGGEPPEFLDTPFLEGAPNISPDGRWLAYVSDESGQEEIYARSFPDGGRPWLISLGGGRYPLWSRTGDELLYESEGFLTAAALEFGAELTVSSRTPLFPTAAYQVGVFDRPANSYDVSPDGERFLMIRREGQLTSAAPTVVVVLNVFQELGERLGR